jgi:hypothetical protein
MNMGENNILYQDCNFTIRYATERGIIPVPLFKRGYDVEIRLKFAKRKKTRTPSNTRIFYEIPRNRLEAIATRPKFDFNKSLTTTLDMQNLEPMDLQQALKKAWNVERSSREN